MKVTFEKVGTKLRMLRKKRGLTLQEVANMTHMDIRSVIDIEMGRRNPTLRTLYHLCKVLRVKSSDLLPF